MKLRVNLPLEILLDEEVLRVKAEGPQGHFTLMEQHIDMVSALAPSILRYVVEMENGKKAERYVAVMGGILVKAGADVAVATRNAVLGELDELEDAVAQMLEEAQERERGAQTAAARIEAGFVRSVMELGK